jgi:DNA-binding XRE family transcriptional regulator
MKDWYSLTDPEILMEFGSRLRLVRIEKNMTQQMLADRSGLNRTTIRDVEKGCSISGMSLIQLLRGLELLERIDNFIPGVNQSPVLAKLQRERKRVKLSRK